MGRNTRFDLVLGTLAVAMLFAGASATAATKNADDGKTVESKNIIALRTLMGDKWIAVSAKGAISGGAAQAAQPVYIEKTRGSKGPVIRVGDRVVLRGANNEFWFRFEGHSSRTKRLVGKRDRQLASEFVVEPAEGSTRGDALRASATRFRLRGLDHDPWIRVGPKGKLHKAPKSKSNQFLVQHRSVPEEIKKKWKAEMEVQRAVGKIRLGWTKLFPCTRVKGFSLQTADQRLVAYASFDSKKVKKKSVGAIKKCAAQATAAAGVSSIIASPSAALPTFKAAFFGCLKKEAAAIRDPGAKLWVETECRW